MMKSTRDLTLVLILVALVGVGSTSAGASTASAPEMGVSGISPAAFTAGELVTIRGTNLQTTQGVSFGPMQTAVASSSVAVDPGGTWVRAVVPAGLPTGPTDITLNVAGWPISIGPVAIMSGGIPPQPNPQPTLSPIPRKTPSFIVRVAPRIGDFSPSGGVVGTRVTINGAYLGHLEWVKFGGVRARVISSTPTRIVALVPKQARSGKLTVDTAGGKASSGERFALQATATAA